MIDSGKHPGTMLRRLAIGALAVALFGAGTFWWLQHPDIERVTVVTGSPQCEGTTPTTHTDPVDGFTRPAIPLTKGFTCLVTLKIANDGERDVQLGTLRFPIGGNQGGAAFHVTDLGDDAAPADDGPAAVTDLDRSLEPGEEELVTMAVVFRESGCTARGSQWVVPTVEVSAKMSSTELRVVDLPLFLGTADSSCHS